MRDEAADPGKCRQRVQELLLGYEAGADDRRMTRTAFLLAPAARRRASAG